MTHAIRKFGVAGLLLTGLGIALTARAAVTNGCTVETVQYQSESLFLTCTASPSTIYLGPTTASPVTGCTKQSVDEVKIWVSMLQSALLSGRPVDLSYTAASGGCGWNLITSVKLR